MNEEKNYLKIKILHTIYDLNGGGTQRQLLYLVNNEKNKNINHAIFCVDDLARNKVQNNVMIYSMKRKTKYDFGIFKLLSDTIENYKPDIIHAWLPHYITIPSMFIAEKYNIPCIYSYRNTRKLKSIRDFVEYLFILKYSDKIVSNNDIIFSSKFYKYLFRIKNGEIIDNGFPIEEIKKKSNKKNNFLENNKFNLLFSGRLIHQKNLNILIEAFHEIKQKNKFKLYICGEGYLKKQLIEKINNLKLNKYISILGYREDIYSIMKNSDLLILPSKFEGMPNTLFESMILGLPVLASNIGQHKKWIDHKKNGFLFNKESAEDLCIKINEIFENKYLYNQVKKKEMEFVKDFDIDNMIDKYRKLYEGLARCKNGN